MRLRLLGACLLGSMSAACGGKVIFDTSSSAGGASSSTHAVTQGAFMTTNGSTAVGTTAPAVSVTTASNVTTVGVTSKAVSVTTAAVTTAASVTSGASMCDTGQTSTPPSPVCDSCAKCAEMGICGMSLSLLQQSPDGQALVQCFQQCPQTDQNCFTMCEMAHAQGAQLYTNFLTCVVCDACPQNCSGAMNCPPSGG